MEDTEMNYLIIIHGWFTVHENIIDSYVVNCFNVSKDVGSHG